VMIFCDTSALYAVVDKDNVLNDSAHVAWAALTESGIELLTTNYVVVELVSLVQRRLGFTAAADIFSDMLPALDVMWIDQEGHNRAYSAWVLARRRYLSLVDCASFDLMRQMSIEVAFEFDEHFAEQGFTRYDPS